MEHLARATHRIEDLWLKGTDYDRETVLDAMASNRMLHLDMDFTDQCDLGCFYCDRTPDRFSKQSKRKLTTDDRKSLILQAKALEAVSERECNGGRSGFDVIPGGCETRPGRHHVEPDRPCAA